MREVEQNFEVKPIRPIGPGEVHKEFNYWEDATPEMAEICSKIVSLEGEIDRLNAKNQKFIRHHPGGFGVPHLRKIENDLLLKIKSIEAQISALEDRLNSLGLSDRDIWNAIDQLKEGDTRSRDFPGRYQAP